METVPHLHMRVETGLVGTERKYNHTVSAGSNGQVLLIGPPLQMVGISLHKFETRYQLREVAGVGNHVKVWYG